MTYPRVLHVLAPMREGGLERVVSMLAVGQKAAGAHVAAVLEPSGQDNHPFVRRLEEAGVPVTRIVVGGRGYLTEYRSLRVLIATLRPTVVHTHGYRSDIICGAAARALRVPTVSTLHGFTGGSRRNRMYEFVQCVALRRFNAVIAVSAPIVDRLKAAGVQASKIHYIPNGFSPSAERMDAAAARQRLGLASGNRIAGWVGRLSQEKGADVMLEALALTDSRWRLSIIGAGPEYEHLLSKAKSLGVAERITWHGAVENAGALLTAFDAFVLSSRTEGTPITLFEAMDAKVPIVATSVGGVPDVVTSDHAILVAADQPAAISKALTEIQSDPIPAAQRSVRARERLHNAYGLRDWLDSIDAVYAGVALTGSSKA
ncbi:MAG TPA: glycosyltransferase [Gemmatimonadaceae bacterium]